MDTFTLAKAIINIEFPGINLTEYQLERFRGELVVVAGPGVTFWVKWTSARIVSIIDYRFNCRYSRPDGSLAWIMEPLPGHLIHPNASLLPTFDIP